MKTFCSDLQLPTHVNYPFYTYSLNNLVIGQAEGLLGLAGTYNIHSYLPLICLLERDFTLDGHTLALPSLILNKVRRSWKELACLGGWAL